MYFIFYFFFKKKLTYLIFLQKFNNEDFRNKLTGWIVFDDQPFTVTECPEFQELIKMCNVNAELPCADTIRSDILNLYENYQTEIKNKLQVNILFRF